MCLSSDVFRLWIWRKGTFLRIGFFVSLPNLLPRLDLFIFSDLFIVSVWLISWNISRLFEIFLISIKLILSFVFIFNIFTFYYILLWWRGILGCRFILKIVRFRLFFIFFYLIFVLIISLLVLDIFISFVVIVTVIAFILLIACFYLVLLFIVISFLPPWATFGVRTRIGRFSFIPIILVFFLILSPIVISPIAIFLIFLLI